ncbi:MAG: diguanylate cyclase [Desulfovibrionaceae bacterium]
MDSLRGRIRFFSLVLVLLPMVISSIMLLVYARGSIRDAALRELGDQTQSQRIFLDDWVASRENAVRFLSMTDAVREHNLDAIRDIFKRYHESHPDVGGVVYFGADGNTVFDSSSNLVINVADRAYFLEARAGRASVSDVLIGRTTGKAIIIFSHPVQDADGQFAGVVIIPAQLRVIDDMVRSLDKGGDGESYLVDRDGLMLTESRHKDVLKQQGRVKDTSVMHFRVETQAASKARMGQQPDGPYDDYLGRKVLGATARANGGEWLIISEIAYSTALRPFRLMLFTVLGGALGTLLLLAPVLFRLVRSIEEPIARLNEYAAKMRKGQFEMSCSGSGLLAPPREIDSLLNAFCAMQAKVEETVEALERSSVTDQLTGLPNRRHLMNEGLRIMNVAARAGKSCGLLVLDIDHFKAINDTWGHQAGDEVLRQLAKILLFLLRSSDLVARFGGEEFVLLAPGSDGPGSASLAERVRATVEAHEFNTGADVIRCTVSIGIALHPPRTMTDLQSFEELFAKADAALYKAKQAGRNRIESA